MFNQSVWRRISAGNRVDSDADIKSDAGFISFNVGSGLCLSIVRTQISWLSSICRVILPIPLRLIRSLAGSDILC